MPESENRELSPELMEAFEQIAQIPSACPYASQRSEVGSTDWMDALEEARRAVNRLSDHANDMRYMKEFYEVNRAWHILFNLPLCPESDGASIVCMSDGGRET